MYLRLKELLTEENMSQTALAKELVNAGIYRNVHSAINSIQYHINGQYKSIDERFLRFLMKRFNKEHMEDIVTFTKQHSKPNK